uniref:Uncharacterized protein n=1 Tax=Ulva partita TaxID=1605170 RepID=A0A1C9ZPN2_9CHLO|nr:hypothetical protein [Ulva partita]
MLDKPSALYPIMHVYRCHPSTKHSSCYPGDGQGFELRDCDQWRCSGQPIGCASGDDPVAQELVILRAGRWYRPVCAVRRSVHCGTVRPCQSQVARRC